MADTAADTGADTVADTVPDPTPALRYADEVVEAPSATVPLGTGGFGDPAQAANGVRGGGAGGGGMDVFSLGSTDVDGYLVLRWSGARVVDGPGYDLAVFENPFIVGAGPNAFMDPVVVEVSRDGQSWVALPHDYTAPDETLYSSLPEHWPGFAGVHPVLYHEEDNPVDPLNPQVAGGDAYDLADLAVTAADDPEAAAILAQGFVYVRLTAATARTNPDTGQPYPHDPISNGPDIDGVYARVVPEAP